MRLFLTVLCISLTLSFPAMAQSNIALKRSLNDLNRIKPLQNPRFETINEFRERRILDTTNKVAGIVKDALFQPNGTITSLLVSFDRLRLNQEVYLNYQTLDIGSVSTGYRLGFRNEEIASLYPELLANIETAAGQNGLQSVKNVIGRNVITDKGRRIGKVSDILFNESATRVMGIYVNVTFQSLRNEGIALPLNAVTFKQRNTRDIVEINQDFADNVIEYIRER